MTPARSSPRELVAADRCDSCSAAAAVLVTAAWGELMFCGHHYAAAAEKLAEAGAAVAVDNRPTP